MNSATAIKDFPDWMGPMLIKELRQGMKARAFEVTFVTLQAVLVLVLSYHALLYGKHGEKFEPSGLHAIFWVIVAVQLLVITPLRALVGLSAERKANTLELIFMTGLTSWRIAFGKWASLMFQAVLFVLAVMPYAFLRYFFGGVNLTEDVIALGGALLACGVLTALTLAISGLPLFFRIAAMGVVGFGAMMTLPALIFGIAMRGTMMSFGFSGGSNGYWSLLIYNVVLVGSAALAFAAATIAPLAENHAMRQRLIAFAALLPVPLMMIFGAREEVILTQVIFFGILALVTSWLHLSAAASPLRVQMEPFSKRGIAGFIAGTFLQPGWPGAVLFVVATELLLIGLGASAGGMNEQQFQAYCATFLMAGAALLTPVLIWRICRKRAKFALIGQTVILFVCGLSVFFLNTLVTLRGEAMGETIWTAIIPPVGFWAMLDKGLEAKNVSGWVSASAGMFSVQVLVLLLLSRSYWKRLSEFHQDIRAAKKEPLVMDGIPA